MRELRDAALYDGPTRLWEYAYEGGRNVLFRYCGDDEELRGRVLRLRKGEDCASIAEDHAFHVGAVVARL